MSILTLTINNLLHVNKKIVQEPYILFVGDRKRYKNFNNLVKAYKMNNKIYDDFKLVVFGGEEFSKTEIENFKDAKLDLSKIVKCSGDDQILANLYENAELFVFPSKYEGFGLPLLEASAKNCPIACSNINVFKEITESKGVYFDPNIIQSIANSIKNVVEDTKISNELIEYGRNRVKDFDFRKLAPRLKEIYLT